jgi:hypothetical protein
MSLNYRNLTIILAAYLALVIADGAGWMGWLLPYDDSDPRPERSGLVIKRDALTGCEYLVRPFSGMSPRMGADGKQICRMNHG